MPASIITLIIGIICIFLGAQNAKGNISSLHSYHRHRVSEKERLPFGRLVGLGTIIVGGGIILFSILSAVTFLTDNDVYIFIGDAVMIIGIVVGLSISFYAMKKYNGGIF